jgi:hypothetical protein
MDGSEASECKSGMLSFQSVECNVLFVLLKTKFMPVKVSK